MGLFRLSLGRIASVAELKAEAVPIHPNPELVNGFRRGIPQGTPISAAASNLYMMKFDVEAHSYCKGIGALYRRYSDDILVICKPRDAGEAKSKIMQLIGNENLSIAQNKTEETHFDENSPVDSALKSAQYLGFTFYESGPAIRASSLSRQWRKMRRTMKRRRRQAEARIAIDQWDRVYTKQLYRRFTNLKVNNRTGPQTVRNFSSYARRSAKAFGDGKKILKQVKRLERAALTELAELKELPSHSDGN